MLTKTSIERYFNAEKQSGLLFVVLGAAAIIQATVFLLFSKPSLYRGSAIPFLIAGIFIGIIGCMVYKRSDADRIRNVYAFDMNPGDLKNKEVPRLEKLLKSIVLYLYTAVFLLLVGAGLYIYSTGKTGYEFWQGLGLALAIMSLLALIGEYMARKRAKSYLEDIKTFTAKF
jgi:hypothetical protein